MASYWLMDLEGSLLAVEAEDSLQVLSASSLAVLPLGTPALAGVALIDDQTVMVGDVAFCLGFSPATPSPEASLLRYTGENRGFLAAAPLRLLESSGCRVFALPEGMHGAGLLQGCIEVDGLPVPVLDLRRLQTQFSGANPTPPKEKISFSFHAEENYGNRWRLIQAAGKPFALPESLFSSPLRQRPPIAVLPLMPEGMAGICIDNEVLLPVWSLGKLLGDAGSAEEDLMLVGGTASMQMALLVESGRGETVTGFPLSLPPWGSRPGIGEALWREGEVIPCLLLAVLLQQEPCIEPHGRWEEIPPPEGLPGGEWNVTEFTIAGRSHAILTEECDEILRPLAWFPVPGLSPLIAGVSFWQGAFWPVVDLSSYFGPHRDLTEAGCMIPLRRGRYRLLLLAENFQGRRIIAPGDQRHLPLHLPHPLVNGCYLDEQRVVLLLDALALIHYFDAALLQTFRAALEVGTSGKKPLPPVEQCLSSPGVKIEGAGGEVEDGPGAVRVEQTREVFTGESRKVRPLAESGDGNGSPRAGMLPDAGPQGPPEEEKRPPGFNDRAASSKASRLRDSEVDPAEAGRRGPTDTSRGTLSGADLAMKGNSGLRSKPALPPRFSAKPRTKRRAEVHPEPQHLSGKAGIKAGRIAVISVLLMAVFLGGWMVVQPPASPQAAPKAIPTAVPTGTGQPLAAAASAEREGKERGSAAPAAEPATKSKVGVGESAAFVAEPREISKKREPAMRVPEQNEETEQPLAPVAARKEPYIVQKGDTLWHLSEKFLDNPHEYNEVARKNSIADPDRIYPGKILQIEKPAAPIHD